MTTDLIPNDQLLEGSVAYPSDPRYSDGIVPKKFWVSPNGTDGDAGGTKSNPFQTITFGLTKCATGRGDTLYVGPGSYAERVTVNKAGVSIIGTGNRHTGLTQIIGPGTGATTPGGATVYVAGGYEGGFRLSNVELDTNGLSVPALHIQSNDTGTAPVATTANYRFMVSNVSVRSNDPDVGILFEGATLGDLYNLYINGPTSFGIAFCDSPSNTCSDLYFEKVVYAGSFSGTPVASIGSCSSASVRTTVGAHVMTNVVWNNVFFGAVGTGAPTNHINFAKDAGAPHVGHVMYEAHFPTQPTNGSAGVATLPTNMVVSGIGTTAGVFLKG